MSAGTVPLTGMCFPSSLGCRLLHRGRGPSLPLAPDASSTAAKRDERYKDVTQDPYV